MKLNMEWLKHWKNGIKHVDRLLNFYYTCVKTQWIWRTTSKGVWEKTVFQGVGKFSKIMLPRTCSASNVSWKRLISKFRPTYHFCLPSLVRTSIAPCHHHGKSHTVEVPDQTRLIAIANHRTRLITPTTSRPNGGSLLLPRTYQQWAVANHWATGVRIAKRQPIKRKQALVPHNGESKTCL